MRISRKPKHEISREMIGLFFEDINYAADGGLYAEMIENRSFEAKEAVGVVHRFYTVDDFGYAWHMIYGEGEELPRMQYVSGSPLSENNPHYLRFTARKAGQGFANRGYDGIVLRKGTTYNISFYARCVLYNAESITVRVTKDGKTNACEKVKMTKSAPYIPFSDLMDGIKADDPSVEEKSREIQKMHASGRCREKDWIRYECVLTAEEDVRGASFEILLDCAGIIEFDLISMIPGDAVAGVFRKDLFEALKDIHPGFIRFPGGCIVEGVSLAYRYRWKNTIGDIKDRKVIPNLWSFAEDADVDKEKDPYGLVTQRKDSHYMQTFGIGFYEYFLLCELLEAKPLPVLNIGTACQFRTTEIVDENSEEFETYIQDALDLIEFANGPVNSRWGNVRASMGHPEPFHMDFLAIGNEQWNTRYLNVNSRYEKFEKAIHDKYPEMRLLGTAGPFFGGDVYEQLWNFYRDKSEEKKDFVYAVDEHYYRPTEWFYENVNAYDNYSRAVNVFAGEYAAHTIKKENCMESALAEAAFMTGLEKNADVVRLASYAPLFNRIGHSQWKPDMIWFDDVHVCLTPDYYVQKLYGNNMGVRTLDMDGQEKALQDEGVYVSLSETTEGEIILKAVNRNQSDYTLPLSDEDDQPLHVLAKMEILIACDGQIPEGIESCCIKKEETRIDGKVVLPKESFVIIRF